MTLTLTTNYHCKLLLLQGNESMWRRWYEDNEPESIALPDYENRILEQADTIGPFYKLLLVRSLRMDRTILTCKEFIRSTAEMGPAYVEPVTDTIEMIYDDMVAEVPVIFLLSIGKFALVISSRRDCCFYRYTKSVL
jgi:dynein heavy chain, axonemal